MFYTISTGSGIIGDVKNACTGVCFDLPPKPLDLSRHWIPNSSHTVTHTYYLVPGKRTKHQSDEQCLFRKTSGMVLSHLIKHNHEMINRMMVQTVALRYGAGLKIWVGPTGLGSNARGFVIYAK